MLPTDLQELLSALNAHRVKYLVVGGYAFGIYTEPRATKDLDVWIAVSEENSEAAYRALASFGAPLSGLTPADFRDGESWFQMGLPPARFDVLQRIDAVNFDQAWETRVPYELDGIPVSVISRDLLIRNKSAVGRPRDIADVAELIAAEKLYR